jgi:hypothetical protein
MNSTRWTIPGGCFVYIFLLLPGMAHAQSSAVPFSDPAPGENYHFEVSGNLWNPPLGLKVASESLGLVGTSIDAVLDLGLERKTLGELRVVVRPAKKHKIRFSYLPMRYSGQTTLHREFIFNGQRFGVNLPLTTELEWNTMLLAYEYDFLHKDNWFVGFTLNSKFTNTKVNIASPIGTEFATAQAPVPTIGGVARVYIVPNVSVTADISGIKIPDSINEGYRAHYFDFDLYGTVNINRYVGAQVGYRRIDVGYHFKLDDGTFQMKGLYFGGVVRY